MKKGLVVLLALAGFAMLEPRSRDKILQLVPAGEMGRKRSAQKALREIAAEVRRAASESGVYPQPGSLEGWLAQRDRSGDDPWGSTYYLELTSDSFVVGSPGPDARVGSDDDLRLTEPLIVPEPGVLIVDHQPAAPPSSAASTAKSKALEAAERRR